MSRAHPSDRWHPIEGYEGLYSVSPDGRVYSHRSEMVLKPYFVHGYPVVGLKVGGKRLNAAVHRVVARAFHGPRPAGKECAHLDGNSRNAGADNLAWVTKSENERHKIRHKTACVGERAPLAKLTNEQADLVRLASQRALTRRELGALLKMDNRTIRQLLKGSTYRG